MTNLLSSIIDIIKLLSLMFLLEIIICHIFYYHYCFIRNFIISWKYKRERIEKDENFRVMHCKEEIDDGGGNRIYIINENKKTYYHIVDPYTLNRLGLVFEDASQNKDRCFSKEKYQIGNRIKIHNLIVDFKQKIILAKKFKEILK